MASHVVIQSDRDIFVSNGLSTFKKVSLFELMLYWISLTLGMLGLLYILLASSLRLVFKNLGSHKQLQWPVLSLLLFALPVLAYLNQSFLSLGELTLASGLLFMVSSLLPISLVVSSVTSFGMRRHSNASIYDSCAALALLQLCAVLIYWACSL
jgi:hypothetical protein